MPGKIRDLFLRMEERIDDASFGFDCQDVSLRAKRTMHRVRICSFG
jgi:hypothetical protein